LSIREVIKQKETLLERLQVDIKDTEVTLDSFLSERNRAQLDMDGSSPGAVAALEHLDSEAENSRAILRQLISERDETHHILETHRALLSPIRRIPTEMLSEIFNHCLSRDKYLSPRPDKPPLLLAQVSKTWRAVALSTPQLWTSISISLSPTSAHPDPHLIQQWIDRSGSRPLSFHIAESIHQDNMTAEALTSARVLDLFIPYYLRWQNVFLEYQDWRLDTGLSRVLDKVSPPLLESLHLARDWWRPIDTEQLLLLLSAPRLRKITWTSNTTLMSLVVPFAQLTELFLERPILMEECLSILRDSPNLVSCQFLVLATVGSLTPSTDSPRLTPMVHNLRSLDLTAEMGLGGFLDLLELPHLAELTLGRIGRFPPLANENQFWPQAQFTSLLSRSKCSLEQLHLCDMDLSPSDMIDCLQQVSPSLERLILANDGRTPHASVTDDVLKLLTYRPDLMALGELPPLCPKLEFVKFWGCSSSTDGVLADMIESRWLLNRKTSPVKPLSIVFVMLGPTHPGDISRLEALNKERIGISILRR